MSRPAATQRLSLLTFATALVLSSAGCHVEKHRSGDQQDVKIDLPFGGLSVKTNSGDAQTAIGLPVYPGAQLEKRASGHDGAANVNLNFGGMHLGVQAAGYTSTDTPDRIFTFYRKQLAQYGPVIECRGKKPVGTPTHTPDGLTCDSDNGHVKTTEMDEADPALDKLEAGSPNHRHVVEVRPQNGGSHFELVALELPRAFTESDGVSGDRAGASDDKQ